MSDITVFRKSHIYSITDNYTTTDTQTVEDEAVSSSIGDSCCC